MFFELVSWWMFEYNLPRGTEQSRARSPKWIGSSFGQSGLTHPQPVILGLLTDTDVGQQRLSALAEAEIQPNELDERHHKANTKAAAPIVFLLSCALLSRPFPGLWGARKHENGPFPLLNKGCDSGLRGTQGVAKVNHRLLTHLEQPLPWTVQIRNQQQDRRIG